MFKKIDPRTELQCEAAAAGRVHLRDDDDFPVTQHREVARLARFVRDFLHQRARFGDKSLQRMMPVREFEKFQREFETLVGQRPAKYSRARQGKRACGKFRRPSGPGAEPLRWW